MGLVYAQDNYGSNIPELSACSVANKLPYAFELSSILFFLAPWTLIIVLYILIGLKLYTSKRNSSRTTCSAHCRHTACLSSTNTRATGRVVKMLGKSQTLYLSSQRYFLPLADVTCPNFGSTSLKCPRAKLTIYLLITVGSR